MKRIFLAALIVAVVVSLLPLTGCGTSSLGRGQEARAEATRADISNLHQAIERFALDVGRYPTIEEGLNILEADAAPQIRRWRGPYIKAAGPLADGWGTSFQYSLPDGENYRVLSAGPDRQFGTEDDVGINP